MGIHKSPKYGALAEQNGRLECDFSPTNGDTHRKILKGERGEREGEREEREREGEREGEKRGEK
jgi:hypothetical protein